MNDISSELVSDIDAVVRKEYPDILVTRYVVNDDEITFPALVVKYEPQEELPGTHDSSGVEKWTRTKVYADAYSRTSMTEAGDIISLMDGEMRRLGFSRSNWIELPTTDPSIRRVRATWLASVGVNGDVASW